MSEADKADLAAAQERAAVKEEEKAKVEEQLNDLAAMMTASIPAFYGWTPPSFDDFQKEEENEDSERNQKKEKLQPIPSPPSAGI